MAVALGMLALGGMVLLDMREDAWHWAEQSSTNLSLALERDIARNIAAFDLSLQAADTALRQPGIDQASPAVRRMALFDRAASAEYLGSILVLDAAGEVIENSVPAAPLELNFADRDYFRIHQAQPDAGLYISRPYRSRLRGGDASIAVSRRRSGPEGRFEGVVMGALRLAYFHDMFKRLDLGPNGSVTLFRADGAILARLPFREDDLDSDLSQAGTFRRFAAAPSGSFVGSAALDGSRRLYVFRRIGDLPLILSVAVAIEDIYAAWWHRALTIGAILAALCGATLALCLLFRREMLRRLAAEASLARAAAELSVMAATDGLTGLVNRRQFDLNLRREWRRALRDGTPLSLLLIDADCFKAYNDHYGHQEGDLVLRSIAGCIRDVVRRSADAGARYGGEEFVVLLPETDIAGALGVAERLRDAVAGLGLPHAGSPSGQVTVSIGVATARPHPGETEGLLIREADEALYEAKRAGRNRVDVAGRGAPAAAAWMPSAAAKGG